VGKPALIEALSIDFKDIARTARAIHLDDPSFPVAAYRHPGTYVETPITTHADALLLLLEDQVSDSAEQKTAKAALRARFIAYELPANFVEDLRADRVALAARNEAKNNDNQEGVASTAAIENLLAQAREIIQRLDAAFLNKYRNDPPTIAAWKSASRVERAPKRQQDSPPPRPNTDG
jgi:urease accessory protein UreF